MIPTLYPLQEISAAVTPIAGFAEFLTSTSLTTQEVRVPSLVGRTPSLGLTFGVWAHDLDVLYNDVQWQFGAVASTTQFGHCIAAANGSSTNLSRRYSDRAHGFQMVNAAGGDMVMGAGTLLSDDGSGPGVSFDWSTMQASSEVYGGLMLLADLDDAITGEFFAANGQTIQHRPGFDPDFYIFFSQWNNGASPDFNFSHALPTIGYAARQPSNEQGTFNGYYTQASTSQTRQRLSDTQSLQISWAGATHRAFSTTFVSGGADFACNTTNTGDDTWVNFACGKLPAGRQARVVGFDNTNADPLDVDVGINPDMVIVSLTDMTVVDSGPQLQIEQSLVVSDGTATRSYCNAGLDGQPSSVVRKAVLSQVGGIPSSGSTLWQRSDLTFVGTNVRLSNRLDTITGNRKCNMLVMGRT